MLMLVQTNNMLQPQKNKILQNDSFLILLSNLKIDYLFVEFLLYYALFSLTFFSPYKFSYIQKDIFMYNCIHNSFFDNQPNSYKTIYYEH